MPHSQPATLALSNHSPESLIGQVADEFLRRREAGERPSVEEYARRYPEIADKLRRVLAALLLLDHSAGSQPSEGNGDHAPLSGVLGDFRVLQEIGRGGMGVVYEAEQISLGRRVALKILPFASMLDPRQLTRFQNEARATATLNHPHIVPVYTTGAERGVHYLAMRLIDGESLARYGMRGAGNGDQGNGKGEEVSHSPSPRYSGERAGVRGEPLTDAAPHPNPLPGVPGRGDKHSAAKGDTLRAAAISTLAGGDMQDWYRRVAQWGVEAAEALEHAHSLGIVHRDIKPGNLLIDGDNKLWVTDFGLARLPTDAGLTMTGDVMGTLRYMSPEQALAKHGLVDHRTDIYALGATLYELLTGRPVVGGKDREEILKSLSEREPTPLRKYAPRIPVDLETVVLKAIAREARDRYISAEELGADLRRILRGEPIKARRVSVTKRAIHWAKRRAGVLASVTLLFVIALTAALAYGVQRYAQYTTTVALAEESHRESLRFQDEHKWHDALAAAKRAKALAEAGVADEKLLWLTRLRLEDVEAAIALDEVRVQVAVQWDRADRNASADQAYSAIFDKLGVDNIDETPIAETVERLKRRTVLGHLAVSLDSWAAQLHPMKNQELRRNRRLELAQAVDSDRLRNQIRKAIQQPEEERRRLLMATASDPSALDLPPVTMSLLAEWLLGLRQIDECLAFLRAAQSRHPSDFWLNQHLGAISVWEGRDAREAIGFMRVSLSMRPQSAAMHRIFGDALKLAGKNTDAKREREIAVELEPNAVSYAEIGVQQFFAGQFKESRLNFQQAINLDPLNSLFHVYLGNADLALGDVARARQEFDQAIELRPTFSHAFARLAAAYLQEGKLNDALETFQQAVKLGERKYDSLYNAACVAALASADTLRSEAQRRELRDDVEKWLRESLLTLDAEVGAVGSRQHWHRVTQLSHWQVDADLAVVREPRQLARLDAEERAKWEAFWQEVAALRTTALEQVASQSAPIPDSDRAKTHYHQGFHLFRGSRLEEAQTEFQKVLEIDPAFERARLRIACIHIRKNEREVALAAIPDELRARGMVYVLYYSAGNALAAHGALDTQAQESQEGQLLRQQAEQWLREALDLIRQEMQAGGKLNQIYQEKTPSYWQQDADLASIRDPEKLAKLPEEERRRWESLWSEVAKLAATAKEQ